MNRKETTEFLSDLLVQRKLAGKYYASEVTLDFGCGKGKEKRVDFVQFVPKNQSTSGIEKGEFIFYEVKSCKDDYHSGNGLNFEGDRNYIVTTMETYKQIIHEKPWEVGIYVACPEHRELVDEFENPTSLDDDTVNWTLKIALAAHPKDRQRSMSQLLFYMLRSGK
jgi:hypothetical protein